MATNDFLFMDAAPTPNLLTILGVSPRVASPLEWSRILTPLCAGYGVETKVRLAMFLANVLHESAMFGRLSESLNYAFDRLVPAFGAHRITADQANRYGRKPGEGPLNEERQRAIANIVYGGAWGLKNLGNKLPDDGWTFRGGGLIQLTGRANYERFAETIGATCDAAFLSYIRTPQGAALSAVQFWQRSGCGVVADREDLEGVRRIINGGTKGLDEVRALYTKALAAIDKDEFG